MTEPLVAARRLGVVFFPAFDWAISATHPEREERLLYTRDQLQEEGLFDIPGITEYRPSFASHAQLARAHFCLPSVGAVSTDSHLASAGGAIAAARLVLEKKEDKAFALVRPPGHHAMRVVHGNRGFCNINNEAVMVEYIRDHYPHPDGRPLRIAIVDTDVHHGDGTQDVFWNDPHTLFISLHQDGRTLSISPCRRKPRTRATFTPSSMPCCPFWPNSSRIWSSIPPDRTITSPTRWQICACRPRVTRP